MCHSLLREMGHFCFVTGEMEEFAPGTSNEMRMTREGEVPIWLLGLYLRSIFRGMKDQLLETCLREVLVKRDGWNFTHPLK